MSKMKTLILSLIMTLGLFSGLDGQINMVAHAKVIQYENGVGG
ncbi:hypothetical protein P4V47_03905 [Brevibacillus laterosporus]|nr:hypothetical protein [Brevibacillus laterosporus]